MDKKSFPRPDFINPNYDLTHFYTEGGYTIVGDLEKVPQAVRNQLSYDEKPVVIKQYKPDGLASLFPGMPIQEQARGLKRRQETTKKFFEEKMPVGTVPGSLFILGGTTEDTRIYEIQEKVKSATDVMTLLLDKDPVATLSKLFPEEKIQDIGRELKAFTERAKEVFDPITWQNYPELDHQAFDALSPNNVVIDVEGHIRMFDTNALFPWSEENPEFKNMYLSSLDNMTQLADKLMAATPAGVR